MVAKVIDGKAFAAALRDRVADAVKILKLNHQDSPGLAVVLVGDDPASQVYVKNKVKFTKAAGMRSIERRLAADTSEKDIIQVVKDLNQDTTVDGILVQLPLPGEINSARVIEQIDPAKDVDGLTEVSAGRLSLGKSGLRPCTPTGCIMLAKDSLGDLSGKRCVILGRSILVGKPAAMLFLEQNCTVTIAHSKTCNLEAICREADILIAAVGYPEMVKAEWVKPGACIIDVGINRMSIDGSAEVKETDKTRLVGDVDYQGCFPVAGCITPVPGGVGPMTIACLLRNTIIAASRRRGWGIPEGLDF